MKTTIPIFSFGALGVAVGATADCTEKKPEGPARPTASVADTIYFGAEIVTMDAAQPSAETLAVKVAQSSRSVDAPM